MIAAEQFRRRLMAQQKFDSGYISFGWNGYVQQVDSGVMICGYDFNLSQIASIKRNNENVPITRIVELPGGQSYDITINYKGLVNANEMCMISSGASGGSYRTLSYIDLSHLDTLKVVSMRRMFYGMDCELIGLNQLSVGRVQNMSRVFGSRNKSFIHGEIDAWDTRNVEDFSYAFAHEGYVMDEYFSIDISGWDTSRAVTMEGMFSKHTRLNELRMMGPTNPNAVVTNMFAMNEMNGKFYYNPLYDYSHIIAQLPSTWTAIPVTQ